jgi:hypothetical protein
VLAFRDNPYRAKLLEGRLVKVLVLEGTFRGRTVWILENGIVK